jgi:nucleoid DNA-binding protein
MKKQLKYKQFLQLWYNRMGLSSKFIENHMDEIYQGLLKTIQEEVRLNGELQLKGLGKFYLLEAGGYERRITMPSKNIDDKYFVPVHYLPRFTASQNFKDYVNDALVSKEARRNQNSRKPTPLQKELAQRDAEKSKGDVRRILERMKNTGENLSTVTKDTRMQLRRD